MSAPKQFTSIGGQAVIEGVMMRSPHYMAIAVRKPDGHIIIKERVWLGITDRYPVFKKPFLRGMVTLVESMVNGVEALSYSAGVASLHDTEKPAELTKTALVTSIVSAFAMGLGLFVALPHFLALLLGKAGAFSSGINNPLFHLIDGLIKVSFLVLYVYGISFMKDVYRVFQYHGAEHKSIYAFENGDELTVANARRYTTLHPRCGTSFLLFLLIISILCFSAVFPFLTPVVASIFGLSTQSFWIHIPLVFVKFALMAPVASLSYEFIKMSSCRTESPFFRVLIYPGLMLQKLTTREPTDDQLEVALASLKRVLFLEKNPEKTSASETLIADLKEIQPVAATASEFPEG
jgi:uncharacterized protein YqhQ